MALTKANKSMIGWSRFANLMFVSKKDEQDCYNTMMSNLDVIEKRSKLTKKRRK